MRSGKVYDRREGFQGFLICRVQKFHWTLILEGHAHAVPRLKAFVRVLALDWSLNSFREGFSVSSGASGSRPSGFEVVRFRVRGVGPEGLGLGFTWTPQRRAKY